MKFAKFVFVYARVLGLLVPPSALEGQQEVKLKCVLILNVSHDAMLIHIITKAIIQNNTVFDNLGMPQFWSS
jgi:hypothetical protein